MRAERLGGSRCGARPVAAIADVRQREYVQNGWNLTGDAFSQDEEGYFHFVARNDDMIISAGYNIAGPELEAVLIAREAVGECAVIRLPDEVRGQIVAAFVVLKPDVLPDEATAMRLQHHVKANIAPYKYPRTVRFLEALPKTQTGKIQRFQLKFYNERRSLPAYARDVRSAEGRRLSRRQFAWSDAHIRAGTCAPRTRRELGPTTDPRVELRRLDRFACPRRRPHRRPHRRPQGFGDRGRFDLD
jgi:hypothetical protein